MGFVADFEPEELWRHFDRILTIPRGSRNEQAIRDYVISLADAEGLEHRVDTVGNVVVRKPATAGGATLILQSHLDMVNEKNSDVQHDFDRDPIVPRLEGDYLYATGTTLGADNGLGVAAMLAILQSKSVKHPPLELLFTIDEETGLTGATELDPGLLSGRQLINLDSEEEYTVTVGCSGGAGSTLRLPLEWQETNTSDRAFGIALSGMLGGHSGLDIHLQRGNAIKLLARMLGAIPASLSFRIAAFEGGNKHNAIPREARALIVMSDNDADIRAAMESELAAIEAEYVAADPGIRIEIAEAKTPTRALTPHVARKVVQLIEALPHGVLAMSADIAGLVETSNNVATAAVGHDELIVTTSTRSSVNSALRAVQRRISAIAELAGAQAESKDGYPGWKPDLASKLLGIVKEVHADTHGKAPEVVALHAGLECGVIGEKVPRMDMISFGPQIEHPHSPDERVLIPSVERFWRLLTAMLERLAAA
jgi:dipeptidase D